jgi:hypothetical protein
MSNPLETIPGKPVRTPLLGHAPSITLAQRLGELVTDLVRAMEPPEAGL